MSRLPNSAVWMPLSRLISLELVSARCDLVADFFKYLFQALLRH